ncbi:hypothetical protein TCSYLVIO_003647 [Trypanosoma cruzi]|nr:hypothetical protein TCSYLVIO_003647 [Trypanosoma cruzi]KAF8280329.1 hypothetical protein TcBrA4_0097230 [Trypanosoma cruzi]
MGSGSQERFEGRLSSADGYVTNAQLPGNHVYTGEVSDDTMHGYGVLTTELDVYTGNFYWNMRHGHGTFCSKVEKHPTGVRIYDGEWNMDERQGIGSIQWCNGDTYNGPFLRGRPHGEMGSYNFADGRVYKGEYRHGVRHGIGRLTQKNGEYYEGEFKDGAMTGMGKGWYAGGKRVYEGTWENGKKVRGKLTFEGSKRMYNGDWKHEKPHGAGEMIFANGDHYIGDFVMGKLHGTGSITYHSQGGKTYCGFFMENQPHGKGVLTMPDGSSVVGYFKLGIQLSENDSAAIEQVIKETASLPHLFAHDDACSTRSTPVQVQNTQPPSVASSLWDVTEVTERNNNGGAPPQQCSLVNNKKETREEVKKNGTSLSSPFVLLDATKELTMPKLPTVELENPLLEPNGSCSNLSRKKEGEILVVAASVLAGTIKDGCKGWLEKFSIGRSLIGRSNWRRRYFVLAPFNKGVSLSYFKDESCHKPVALLLLNTNDTRIVTRPSVRTHKEATQPEREICVIYVEKEKEYKLLLRAYSEDDREYWVYALSKLFDIINYPSDFPLLENAQE